ncbi:unnamed protein product, partial [Meganyctiphanes norvegica]
SNQEENKNAEWLRAAVAGETATLTSLLSFLNVIDLDTLELAQGVLNSSGKDDAKAIAEYAIKRKNKEQGKQAQAGCSAGALLPLRALQSQDNAQVPMEQGSTTTTGTLVPPKRVILTLKRSGEVRDVEIESTNTKQLTNAVKDMSGQDSAYALHEIDGETYSSQINVQDFKVEVFTVQNHVPAEDFITFPMSKLQELLSKDNLEVFLDLNGPGRIYIRVDGYSTQGQQFLGLCMGIFGYTYKDVVSNNIINKGMPGERIGFPGYKSIKDDSQKNTGIVSGLEENRMQNIRGGTVAKITPSGGDFVIFTQGNPESKTSVYIGEVVQGLDTLNTYIKTSNPANLNITNVGIHLGTR